MYSIEQMFYCVYESPIGGLKPFQEASLPSRAKGRGLAVAF
jgi:hypothetical protein